MAGFTNFCQKYGHFLPLKLAKVKGTISQSNYRLHLRELELIPSNVEMALQKNKDIEDIAKLFKDCDAT